TESGAPGLLQLPTEPPEKLPATAYVLSQVLPRFRVELLGAPAPDPLQIRSGLPEPALQLGPVDLRVEQRAPCRRTGSVGLHRSPYSGHQPNSVAREPTGVLVPVEGPSAGPKGREQGVSHRLGRGRDGKEADASGGGPDHRLVHGPGHELCPEAHPKHRHSTAEGITKQLSFSRQERKVLDL